MILSQKYVFPKVINLNQFYSFEHLKRKHYMCSLLYPIMKVIKWTRPMFDPFDSSSLDI